MTRVLLTGATGLIGSRAIAPLLQAGHELHAVARRPEAGAGGRDGDPRVRWHAVDLLQREAMEAVVLEIRADKLLHFAWYAEHGRFWKAPENLAWVGATLELLRVFAQAGGTRAVLAGSCAEYEWGSGGLCSEGETPLRPATLYGIAKHATRMVACAYASSAGVSLAWGRIFHCYGPGEDERRLVPAVARALLAGRPAETGDGEQWRDFMHSDDIARAFVALLEAPAEGAINIATGEGVRLAEVIARVAEAAGRPELVRMGARPPREGDPARLLADVSRLRGEVGFESTISLEQGIRDTVEWWRGH